MDEEKNRRISYINPELFMPGAENLLFGIV